MCNLSGFVALTALVVWQQPPLTSRGRTAYFLTGFSGIWVACLILGLCWVLSAGPRYPRPAPQAWERMFGEYLGGTVIGILVAAWSFWLLRKSVMKNSPEGTNDDESVFSA